jgi:hypothetical protein
MDQSFWRLRLQTEPMVTPESAWNVAAFWETMAAAAGREDAPAELRVKSPDANEEKRKTVTAIPRTPDGLGSQPRLRPARDDSR